MRQVNRKRRNNFLLLFLSKVWYYYQPQPAMVGVVTDHTQIK